MKKIKFKPIMAGLRTVVKKHSPEIMTGIGIAGMLTTTIIAVRATPKALALIDETRRVEEDGKTVFVELTPIDKVKTAWKCYIPAAVTGTISIACLVGASSVNAKRNAALATVYALSESALKDYREKAVEVVGEKKERAIREAVAKDKIDKNPVTNNEVVITGNGDTLCYDAVSGRYFYSDMESLRRAANDLNRRMLSEMCVSLNEFYYEIGLSGIKIGEALGWNVDKCNIDLDFSTHLAENGKPCLVIDYQVAPDYNYRRY